MFGRPLRLAGGPWRTAGQRSAQRRPVGPAEAFWLVLLGVVFMLWAMSPHAHRSGGSDPGCFFAGKGGVVCAGPAATAGRQLRTGKADEVACVSLGKGGRVCAPAPDAGSRP